MAVNGDYAALFVEFVEHFFETGYECNCFSSDPS
jgi:hypothetical protein